METYDPGNPRILRLHPADQFAESQTRRQTVQFLRATEAQSVQQRQQAQ